jgi:hypothetical protein
MNSRSRGSSLNRSAAFLHVSLAGGLSHPLCAGELLKRRSSRLVLSLRRFPASLDFHGPRIT